MCNQNQLKKLLDDVAENSRNIFRDSLHSVILFGSYARGDYDEESDVDIFIIADVESDELHHFRKQINVLCGNLLMEYGVVVSIIEKDLKTYNRYADILPLYKNIAKEGVRIA